MTKDELKQKCTERAKIFQQAMESCHSSSLIDWIEWFADRIAELEEQIEKMKCCCNCKRWYNYGNTNNLDDTGYECYKHDCDTKCTLWELNKID